MLRWLKSLAQPKPRPADDAETWMRAAYHHHQGGEYAAALALYQRILAAQPDNADAWYLRGEIARRTGRVDAAVDWLEKAVALRPEVTQFRQELAAALQLSGAHARAAEHYAGVLAAEPGNPEARAGLGTALLELGRVEEAAEIFRTLAAESPHSSAAQVNLGSALQARGRFDAAAACYREALRLDPLCAPALCNLGGVLLKGGEFEQGRRLLKRALALDPLLMEARLNLGFALLKENRHEEALPIIEEAVRLRPEYWLGRLSLGRVYRQAGQLERAIACLQDALHLAPGRSELELDLALNLLETGRLHEALALYQGVVAREPGNALGQLRLGHALELTGEFDAAMACYERAIAIDPAAVQAHVNRAVLRLLRGDFEGGWPEYEWRLREPSHAALYGRFPQPTWEGAALAGRGLLVYAEQGLGDEIMYASCIPELLAQGARVTLDCEPRLAALFARSFPGATVRPGVQQTTPEWARAGALPELKLPIASLPLHLRRSAAAFPRHAGYLRADPARVAAWRERLAALGPGPAVGLAWRGGVPKTGRAYRSLALGQLLPVLRTPGLHFVCLQHDECRPELAQLRQQHGVAVAHWPGALADLDETAALVCALALTVTVCTTVAHLAGALGRPVWVLAPLKPEARYGLAGQTMAWYPAARLFRQGAFGDWNGPLEALAAALPARLEAPDAR